MLTLFLIIILALVVGTLICTLSDLLLLTVAILAIEKVFCRFKKRYERSKK